MADNDEQDWFSAHEERYKMLNNELVIPQYNRFCEENGLNHGLHEILRKSPIDKNKPFTESGIHKLFDLHEKALNIFNRVNKRFHYFRGKIVSFHFVTHLDFTFEEWTVEEFLEDMEELGNTLDVTEKREKIYNVGFYGLLFIGLLWIWSILHSSFLSDGKFPLLVSYIIGGGGIFGLFFLERFIRNYHINKKNREIRRKLNELKTEIEKVKNNP